jgi:glycosyltransferase involved in cell wall biosynthesis
MRRVDALIGISNFVTQSLVDYGYSSEKTHTVLNAIDLSRWDPSLDPQVVRCEFGIGPTSPVIACAARLFREKGQYDLIQALPSVREQFPDVRLLIIGTDDMNTRPTFSDELKDLARRLGVSDSVIFTGQRSDMPSLLAACDVFALPSHEEPFGLVYIEAMAMKKPVIAIDNGGAPEIVEHGKSGLLCKPHDLDSLSANLRTLLGNSELREQMGAYGRQLADLRFNATRMARDVEDLYTSLVRSWGRNTIVLQSHGSAL